MKIAFAVSGNGLHSPVNDRFARTSRFLVYDTEKKKYVVVFNGAVQDTEGAGIKTAEALIRAGAKAIVVGECGPKATDVLTRAGVEIYTAKSTTVVEALDRYFRACV